MEAHIFSSFIYFFILYQCVININTLCTTSNAEPNRYLKKDAPASTCRQEQSTIIEFLIVIQIRWDM